MDNLEEKTITALKLMFYDQNEIASKIHEQITKLNKSWEHVQNTAGQIRAAIAKKEREEMLKEEEKRKKEEMGKLEGASSNSELQRQLEEGLVK